MENDKAYPPQQQGYQLQQQPYQMQPQGYPSTAPPQYSENAPTETVIVRQTQGAQPNDYLAFAIIVTVCCCLPLGIVAIVQSTNVRSRFAAGDAAGAEQASQSAKCWSIASLVTGIVFFVIGAIVIIIYVVFIVSAVSAAATKIDNRDFGSQFYNY